MVHRIKMVSFSPTTSGKQRTIPNRKKVMAIIVEESSVLLAPNCPNEGEDKQNLVFLALMRLSQLRNQLGCRLEEQLT